MTKLSAFCVGAALVTAIALTPTSGRAANDIDSALPTPHEGERWLCYSAGSSTIGTPHIALTRNPPTNSVTGSGHVLAAGVKHEADFSISGVTRVWRWKQNDRTHMVTMAPDGRAQLHSRFGDYFNCIED